MATYIGIDPERAFQRRATAVGCNEQTREHASALSVVGSGDARGRARSEWLLRGNDAINLKWHVFMETISAGHHVSGACYLARVPICETGMKIARRVFDRILSPSPSYRGVG